MRRTKIVATIGPASEKKNSINKMIKAGLNVARLNFSHNKHSHHKMLIENIRQQSAMLGKSVAILQDLQGPKIRIGDVGNKGVMAKKNAQIILNCSINKKKKSANTLQLPVTYKKLYKDVKKGDKILIEDGLIELVIEKITNKNIYCRVAVPGVIKTHKGMNLPDSDIKADSLTSKDLKDLAFGIKNEVDFVSLSFVKTDKDIKRLKKKILALEKINGRRPGKKPLTKVIAKIERNEAVDNFDKILKVADGIMVARGDLGIELPYENVPLVQKQIIHKCARAGKPVIVATQMLDSMIRNPIPTRAEVSDVANAILDGTDAIMLSGESATGKYPLKAVEAMDKIARKMEPVEFKLQQELEPKLKKIRSLRDFISFKAQDLAERKKVKAIVCLSSRGDIVRAVARYKSEIMLLAFCFSKSVANQLSLSWGVSSWPIERTSYEKLIENMKKILIAKKIFKKGDEVVLCFGNTGGKVGLNNSVEIIKL